MYIHTYIYIYIYIHTYIHIHIHTYLHKDPHNALSGRSLSANQPRILGLIVAHLRKDTCDALVRSVRALSRRKALILKAYLRSSWPST